MPTSVSTGLIIAIVWVAFCFGISALLIKAIVGSTWMKIARAHPGVAPAPDAVRRNFQSFKMNLLNLGFSVHVAVDEHYLHLLPSLFLRWFGAQPASVPWDAVQDLGKGWSSHSRKAKIDGVMVWGPAWCLKLAADD